MHERSLIAVVGMDGIFPGALDLDTFWQNIVNGVDRSAQVPEDRWIAPPVDRLSSDLQSDRTYSRHACLIDDFHFDPGTFNLDPDITRQLDPVHQLTLTAGKRAIVSCRMSDLDPERVDTILAAIALPTDSASAFSRRILGNSFERRLFHDRPMPQSSISLADAMASRVDGLPAALLAAEMGFRGNSFTLDAACASSIYAVKLACDALTAGRADMVVTGGVSRPEVLYTQTGFSQLQALSPSGRCAPFDRRADGLVVGEGVGILVLKRLADAIAQDDTIHGVIHGIGLSNDMRGNLLAPESAGQVRAMRAAYGLAGWRPSDVDYIECHGTGTRTGDATEIESLVQLWKDTPVRNGSCPIGSVKSMIGHLLTAAGAAGMIKTLLALKHRILPPSINFEAAPQNSPLNDSPFRVQTSAQPWKPGIGDEYMRAAVSAFGFGGINAHILIQDRPNESMTKRMTDAADLRPIVETERTASAFTPLAVVGMDVRTGSIKGLQSFENAVFQGISSIARRPGNRWKGADDAVEELLDGWSPHGAFMEQLSLGLGRFQIPPKEIDAILPQQLLALDVGAGALADAGLAMRESRPRMGVVVGIGFDFEATNFHLRWQLYEQVRRWRRDHGLELDDDALLQWLEDLRDQCAPPLTSPRVMGALGGIVASRMAREFRFGGPSFVVAADAASGIKGLQVAGDLLHEGNVDAMLVGAVDLAAEGRNVVRMDRLMPLSRTNDVRPFDASADGTLPGDGAAALIVKRLDRALSDRDRIYAVIRGIGHAGGDDPSGGIVRPSTYQLALSRCFEASGVTRDAVSYVETHGSGIPDRDRMECQALASFFNLRESEDPSFSIALGSAKPTSGYAGAADGLISLVKAALCLHHRRLPPLLGFKCPSDAVAAWPRSHFPIHTQPWFRDRKDGPRTACSAAISMDGTCTQVLLQERDQAECWVPADTTDPTLLVLTGDSPSQLTEALSHLDRVCNATGTRTSDTAVIAEWTRSNPPRADHQLALAVIHKADRSLSELLSEAHLAISAGHSDPLSRQVYYTTRPIGSDARIAWVYPGSGNHYLGMGRVLALRFPEVVDSMDRDTARLKTQFRPWHLMPWRQSWKPGWEKDASVQLKTDPLNMIFGQVVFGSLMARVIKRFSVPAHAVIGYSLGESAALFAHGVWADRGDMLERMQNTDLFTTQLSGPCMSLRQAWGLADDETVAWCVAVVNRPAEQVRKTLSAMDSVRLLIVNSPDESVIGGLEPAVKQAIASMGCQAVYLDGVVTVHCDAALPVADAYRELHRFATTSQPGLDVYSCSMGTSYAPTPGSIAKSIEKQAVEGFDFTKTINSAYANGCRIFIEIGPRSSCTRMIDRILDDRPHLAVAANHGSVDEIESLLRCLARLTVERVPMDLTPLYSSRDTSPPPAQASEGQMTTLNVGGQMLCPALPMKKAPEQVKTPASAIVAPKDSPKNSGPQAGADISNTPPETTASVHRQMASMLEAARQNMEATASTHEQFLDLSQELTQAYADGLDLQNRLLGLGARPTGKDTSNSPLSPPDEDSTYPPPAFDRDMCMAFAVGRVGRVLGPAFDVVDTYRVRVRLPDEPLMLVDRIISVDGEMLSMTSGRVVTEHDVLPGAWYLDGDRAPVCISVEAGQADLFLSAYLGIDHQVKGERAYRLLDAEVSFHRGLPRPGETIRYEITIDRFVCQGETWMFFFRFEGFIGDQHLITMRDGCAGFFTEEEVRRSGGIILTERERAKISGKRPSDWRPLVAMTRESYSDDQLDALRRGDLAGCFGPDFAGIRLAESLRLPGGRMRLIHRILELDPEGGRYGLGLIRAEADIHPDDWFLTCHFVDDMVMPGTLMYECCAHTLRVFLQRLGWVTDKPGVCYEPVIGNGARLKCRGPVTPSTRHVHYEIQIREIGFGPEPYAIADAHMFADGHPIVLFRNMSMKMTGIGREAIERAWRRAGQRSMLASAAPDVATPLFDRASILAFATGNPSEAFGEPYRVFDRQRKIARLPGPPYCFMDRVVHVEPEPWTLAPGGWVTAQYDIPANEWYFSADRSGVMPFCVLLEIALQPCGWLAAYAGSALRSQRDLKFRNLGGSAVLHRQVSAQTGTLTMRCRMTKVSEAADMLIENFDFEVLAGDDPVYTGDTYFGFFSAAALAQQKGLGDADNMVASLRRFAGVGDGSQSLAILPPFLPEDASGMVEDIEALSLPGKALLMIDRIDAYLPEAVDDGLAYIRGAKQVDPKEWFFKAHFYQDPVCPGSLGLESFLQLMKYVAINRWPHLAASHRFRLKEGSRHSWTYRGQIIPTNRTVTVEARITSVVEGRSPLLCADGLLSVDGLPIYKMADFELALVPVADLTES